MEVNFTEISKSEYHELELPSLFTNSLCNLFFGVISINEHRFKLGWQSSEVKPSLKIVNNSICILGIDLNLVIYDIINNQIVENLLLDYFFYAIEVNHKFIYVISELEIIKIDISNLNVKEKFQLPDFFESIEFLEDYTIINCIGQEIIKI